ncbi:MAG: hypothetical protein S4CHLAM6_11110 [Chlamydiae bacterium]|nr:hypothetical protein [Chlamydiota bacterium]
MITVSYTFDEKPFLEAKNIAARAFEQGKERLSVAGKIVGRHAHEACRQAQNFAKENFKGSLPNVLLYSSLAASVATSISGSLFLPRSSALALNVFTFANLRLLSDPKIKKHLSPQDQKTVNIAKGNIAINVATQIFGISPTVKLALTAYNTLSSQFTFERT